jgi:hypothetical protein
MVDEELYDPGAHTVDEVNDYLGTVHDAEIDRVLEAEQAGKARVGILSGPYADEEGPVGITGQAAPDVPSDAPTAATYDLVRVKDETTGTEFSVSGVFAESAGLTVIDKPAVDDFGRAIPAKQQINKGVAPASEESA